jgi:hypothetical protein
VIAFRLLIRNPLRLVALLAFWASLCAAQQPIAPPVLQPFADNKQWMLVRDVNYRVGQSSQTIVVSGGFVTDFASIPTVFTSFGLGPNGRYSKAAIVHDYLYWSQGCTLLRGAARSRGLVRQAERRACALSG